MSDKKYLRGIRLIFNKNLLLLIFFTPFSLLGESINPDFGLPYDGEGQGETFCSEITGRTGFCPKNSSYNRLIFHNYFHFEADKVAHLRIDGEFIYKAQDSNKPLFEQVFEEWKGSTVNFTVYTLAPYSDDSDHNKYHCFKLVANSQALPRKFGKIANKNFTVPSAIGDEPLHSPLRGVAFNQSIILGGKNITITSVIDSHSDFTNKTTPNVIAVLSGTAHIDHYIRMWATKYDPTIFQQPNVSKCDSYKLTDSGYLIQQEPKVNVFNPLMVIKVDNYPTTDYLPMQSYYLAARYGIEIVEEHDY